MTAAALPKIRKTAMLATFRAPLSRPGADTRRECWGAETEDGVWGMERLEGEWLAKWCLIFRPWNLEVTFCRSLRSCRELIAIGGSKVWTNQDAPAPWKSLQTGFVPVAWAIRWKGNDMQRAEFDHPGNARAWATEWTS